jgi:hypothetical protein
VEGCIINRKGAAMMLIAIIAMTVPVLICVMLFTAPTA